jgi:hypothetical protein
MLSLTLLETNSKDDSEVFLLYQECILFGCENWRYMKEEE